MFERIRFVGIRRELWRLSMSLDAGDVTNWFGVVGRFGTRFMFDHVAAEIAVARSVEVQVRRCDENQSAAETATRSTWTRPGACRLYVLLDLHVQTGSGHALTEVLPAIAVTPFLATHVKNPVVW